MRYHKAFAPRGTNVNFASAKDGELHVRTYERGVEGETLACGSGSVAAAILAARKGLVSSPVQVRTRGGELLTIHFDLAKEGFGAVFLEGDTSWTFDGKLAPEAWSY
jgi:diaminopimelate epimerase